MDSVEFSHEALKVDGDYNHYKAISINVESKDMRLLHGAIGINTEAGELLDAFKKNIYYNQVLDVENVKEEIGDILWYMSIILDSVGSSFDEVMAMNNSKLKKRYAGGFSYKAAKERADKQ